ncbi:MAG: 2,3-bisphosphoglycerate-independent phosphoglycerate mutase [Gemmataceae bacterium]
MTKLRKRPVVLIVRDGWGHNPHPEHNDFNAVHLANTPVDDQLLAKYPNGQIHTSGEHVGLPEGIMGNSEVGHQNIGAGRVVDQEMMRLTRSARDGSMFTKPALLEAVEHAKQTGGTIHMLGLLSDGGVHSHIEHALALVEFLGKQEIPSERIVLHVITDGRDTSPQSGIGFVERLEEKLKDTGVGRIGSVVGRFYAMDRDYRWERVQRAYDLLTKGGPVKPSATEALKEYYDNPTSPSQKGDEFVTPVSIAPSGKIDPHQLVKDGDSVIFFNFRGDRPREITKAFIYSDVDWANIQNGGFDRGKKVENLYFASMTRYEEGLETKVIFEPPARMNNILGEYLCSLGLIQFRCAESEKHPHVTYFFNDYRKGCYSKEYQIDIPSPKYVSTYDEKPDMSADAVTHAVVNAIESDIFDFVLVNYANGDMVGHTGSLEAAIKAVETVDACVGRVVEVTLKRGGALVVTADHGNCEQMTNTETGGPHTQHTTYDVDLIVVDNDIVGSTIRPDGRLADVAPTVLELLGLDVPADMTGKSLLVRT